MKTYGLEGDTEAFWARMSKGGPRQTKRICPNCGKADMLIEETSMEEFAENAVERRALIRCPRCDHNKNTTWIEEYGN